MNEDLERWCAEAAKPVELTHSRAYKSNDQAWVEQKNALLVRRVVGHRRLEGPQQLERLCQLFAGLRLFTNIYQPSAKRIPSEESDRREGRRPRRRHDQPLTPADRLLRWSGISRQNRQRIEALQQQCDPVDLLETIRWNQAALVNGESEPSSEIDRSASNQDLNAFLGSLRLLWRQSEPAKRGGWDVPKRTYRPRVDPSLLTGQQAMQRLEQNILVCISAACAPCRGGGVSGASPMPNRWSANRWGQSGTRKTASSTAGGDCGLGVN